MSEAYKKFNQGQIRKEKRREALKLAWWALVLIIGLGITGYCAKYVEIKEIGLTSD